MRLKIFIVLYVSGACVSFIVSSLIFYSSIYCIYTCCHLSAPLASLQKLTSKIKNIMNTVRHINTE